MKKIIPLILIISVSVFILQSCDNINGKGKSVQTATNLIIGTWELRSASSGNIVAEPFLPGNGNLLKFNGSTYEVYSQGRLTLKGTYQLSNDDIGAIVILYDKGEVSKDVIKIENGKLTLISTNSDFATREYFRIEN